MENLKKRLAENSLNNHFLPLAKSSSRALLLLPLTRVIYTKSKEKEISHEGKEEKWLGVFDNKRVVSLVGSSKLLKRKKLEKFRMFH